MALANLSQLDQYKAAPFTTGYLVNVRTFYSPVDGVHDALQAVLDAATTSVVVGMYGYDDAELDTVLHDKLTAEHMFVQVSLGSTQGRRRGRGRSWRAGRTTGSVTASRSGTARRTRSCTRRWSSSPART